MNFFFFWFSSVFRIVTIMLGFINWSCFFFRLVGVIGVIGRVLLWGWVGWFYGYIRCMWVVDRFWFLKFLG